MEEQATNPEGSGGLSLREAAGALGELLGEAKEPNPEEETTDAAATPEVEEPAEQPIEGSAEEETDAPDAPVESSPEQPAVTPERDLHTVRVAGEEVQVPYDELLSGYSRQGDYVRKTQAVAEQRKQTEALRHQLEAERGEYKAALPQIAEVLGSFVEAMQPNRALMDTNPGEYLRQQEAYQQHQHKIQAVQAEQQRMQQLDAQQAQQYQQQTLAREQQALVQRMPSWSDPATMQREQKAMLDYGVSLGYSPEELSTVTDHRAVLTLRRAMLYDRARAQGRQQAKAAPPPKTAKPGTAGQAGSTQSKREKQQWDKLRSTGKPADAAPLFEAVFGQ